MRALKHVCLVGVHWRGRVTTQAHEGIETLISADNQIMNGLVTTQAHEGIETHQPHLWYKHFRVTTQAHEGIETSNFSAWWINFFVTIQAHEGIEMP